MSINCIVARRVVWRVLFYGGFSLLGALAIVLFLQIGKGPKEVGHLKETAGRSVIGNGCLLSALNQTKGTDSGGATGITIYVLGGTQDSLRLKYHTAVGLYQKGGVGNFMIASVEGITEYAQDLNRNLTNDEWSVRQLTRQGVKREDINFIMLQDGFFGTLREAKTLKTICIERGIKKLLLVCSSYHCKRVRSTFSAILENTGVEIDIYAAAEQVGMGGLFIEYLKRIFYENLLLPVERYSKYRRQQIVGSVGQFRSKRRACYVCDV